MYVGFFRNWICQEKSKARTILTNGVAHFMNVLGHLIKIKNNEREK
jgi:hypothetical protein